MSEQGSISHLLPLAQQGNHLAVEQIWQRYFTRLVALARERTVADKRRAFDEEDIALSALASFFEGAKCGRFPQLTDRDGLWRLLVVITSRKAADKYKHENRKRRGGGMVVGESALASPTEASQRQTLDQLPSDDPSPEFVAEMAEQCERLITGLDDDSHREVVNLRLAGYSNREIANKIGSSVRSVERKLNCVRAKWSQEELDGV